MSGNVPFLWWVRFWVRRIPMVACLLLCILGVLHWLWIAIEIGSFWMFVVGFIVPLWLLTGPIGLWALAFGVPDWLTSLSGG